MHQENRGICSTIRVNAQANKWFDIVVDQGLGVMGSNPALM